MGSMPPGTPAGPPAESKAGGGWVEVVSDSADLAETLPSSEDVTDAPAPLSALQQQPGQELCGQKLHHFRVEAIIGRGGMGTVYRAHDLSLDRPVALKVIDLSMVADDTLRDRFVREARAQARLNHHHVVQIHYIGDQENLCFFAMEIVEGESLDDLLVRGERLPWQLALTRMIAVAEALRLAQEQGIVHRDVKPSNLLVDHSGVVKVADFGLAKWIKEDVKITQEGAVLGTPLYMSPEQGQGEATDHRSDIYSMGAAFHHLLVGRPPYTATTPVALVVKHVTQPVPSVRATSPDVPADVAAIIERMMAKEPAERYQSYDDLVEALEAARPRRSTPAGLWVRAMALAVDTVLFLILLSLLGDFALLAFASYQVVGWWRWGQTVGKWLFRIRVRALSNAKPTFRQAVLRFLASNVHIFVIVAASFAIWFLSGTWGEDLPDGHELQPLFGGVAGLGLLVSFGLYLVAGFRRDRRAVHDLLAGTKVVYKLDD